MRPHKLYISILLSITTLNVSSQYLINLNFESGFEFESQKILLTELKNSTSKKQIEKIVRKQDWIKDFSLVFKPFKKEVYLSIVNREPVFLSLIHI